MTNHGRARVAGFETPQHTPKDVAAHAPPTRHARAAGKHTSTFAGTCWHPGPAQTAYATAPKHGYTAVAQGYPRRTLAETARYSRPAADHPHS